MCSSPVAPHLDALSNIIEQKSGGEYRAERFSVVKETSDRVMCALRRPGRQDCVNREDTMLVRVRTDMLFSTFTATLLSNTRQHKPIGAKIEWKPSPLTHDFGRLT